VIEMHVLSRGLPLPSFIENLRTASLPELQHTGMRAARFDRLWSAGTAAPVQNLKFDPNTVLLDTLWLRPADEDLVRTAAWNRINQVECLPGDAVLTVHAGKNLVLWRVPRGQDEARCTDIHTSNPVLGIVIDQTPGPTTQICVASAGQHDVRLRVYRFDPLHASLTTVATHYVDMPSNTLWAIKGNLVLYNEPPMIYDCGTGLVHFITHADPVFVQVTFDVRVLHERILTRMSFILGIACHCSSVSS
jgi:hypothetical protein